MRPLILLLPIALVACATTGSNGGVVAIDTAARGQSLPGAACVVTNGTNTWNVTTPASVAVGSPVGDLRVVCNKDGFRTSEMVYQPSPGSYGGSSVGIGAGGGGRHVGLGVGISMPIGGFGGGGGYPARITVDMNPQ
jgi:hypothetical protein